MKVSCTIRNVTTTYDQKLRFRIPYRKSTFTGRYPDAPEGGEFVLRKIKPGDYSGAPR
jgi:hypothetical protein